MTAELVVRDIDAMDGDGISNQGNGNHSDSYNDQ